MKSYASGNEMKMVGKGWEIRRAIGQMIEKAGGDTTLKEYLSGQPSNASSPSRNANRKSGMSRAAADLRIIR